MSRLRRKLNHDPLTEVIHTVRGLGYIFDAKAVLTVSMAVIGIDLH